MLSVHDLTFRFKDNTILNNITIDIACGEILCLLGPNGCGKTTLLNCMTSYYTDYQGDILLKGRSIRKMKLKERAKHLSYVSQMDKESFPYTVFDIVLMGRTPHTGFFGMPSYEDEQIVRKVLRTLEIEQLSHRIFNTLSGGESQLVKLARGLAQKASLHLLDEPTAALDLRHELKLLQTIRSLVTDHNNGVVMATHYPNQPLYFESKGLRVRVCLMKKGEILYTGKPSEVINQSTLRDIYEVDTHIVDFKEDGGEKGHVVIPLKA